MHKSFTVSLQRERSCATFWISFHVKCMALSSFSVDLLQAVLGLSIVFSLLVSKIHSLATCAAFPHLNIVLMFQQPILVVDLGPKREGGFGSWSVILPSEELFYFWRPSSYTVNFLCQFLWSLISLRG